MYCIYMYIYTHILKSILGHLLLRIFFCCQFFLVSGIHPRVWSRCCCQRPPALPGVCGGGCVCDCGGGCLCVVCLVWRRILVCVVWCVVCCVCGGGYLLACEGCGLCGGGYLCVWCVWWLKEDACVCGVCGVEEDTYANRSTRILCSSFLIA